ncbi:hypothetical protein [Enterobacter cloacae complex sp. GF14B]|uniref:hypothetical protein n=1 Tax=Enterobacter cloacae complex sp. GF14B TaxID=2511982 RepID=UPI00100E0D7B|nr:hypothetical protein [Enterobacter cloacae complex sp. GF14B]RYA40657.1 hypothetical protein DD606_25645 [Enterobacter cloacae complex sp. GF14B]
MGKGTSKKEMVATLSIQNREEQVKFQVKPSKEMLADVILGHQWLDQHKAYKEDKMLILSFPRGSQQQLQVPLMLDLELQESQESKKNLADKGKAKVELPPISKEGVTAYASTSKNPHGSASSSKTRFQNFTLPRKKAHKVSTSTIS